MTQARHWGKMNSMATKSAYRNSMLLRDLKMKLAQVNPAAKDSATVSETIVGVLCRKAMKGDLDAMTMIFDRLHGKPSQQIEHTGQNGGPIQYEDITMETLQARLAAVLEHYQFAQPITHPATLDGDRGNLQLVDSTGGRVEPATADGAEGRSIESLDSGNLDRV